MPERRTLTEAEREASGWIVRIKAHDVSDAERQQFEAWRNSDPANAAAYAKMERTWGLVASMQHLKGRAAANDGAPARTWWKTPAAAIAASALLAIGALAWFMQQPSTITAQHIETAPGELRTITLADNSTIQLSPGSDIAVEVTDTERRVELTAGYALFDVTHDPDRPFVVHTPQGDIRVLGTSFVVRIGETQVRTTVIRGSVSGAPSRSGLASLLGPGEAVIAQANEEIVLGQERAEVVPIAAEIIPRRLAWQDNMLAFDGETLNEAIAEVSRQTGWTFELSDPELGEMRVGGYVRADPEAFLALLSSSLGLEAQRDGERRAVLSRRSGRDP
ncbi:MAG: FecR domain-containing protein [Hyphomonadaceae bacterium]